MDEPDDVEAIRYEYDIVDLAILDIAKGGGKPLRRVKKCSSMPRTWGQREDAILSSRYYLDESASPNNSLIVTAGVVVDAYRMRKTKDLWADFLDYLSSQCGSTIKEFHAKEFIAGNGIWRNIDGAERARLISAALRWIGLRAHRVTFSAVLNSRFEMCSKRADLCSPWLASALHCVLTVQKCFQNEPKNKGNTVFVFDKGRDEKALTSICDEPPAWTDKYYNRGKKHPQLNQMIDVPLFADSERALLVQVADLVAYILRRHWEIASQTVPARYHDEPDRVASWVADVSKIALARSFRYPAKERSAAEQVFWDLCPDELHI